MNGSRSSSSRAGGASSLDALSRTIEGLEARIEGLMSGTTARERRDERPLRNERAPIATDPLTEIRERQRALDAAKAAPEPRHPQNHSRAESAGRFEAPGRYDQPRRNEPQSRYEPRPTSRTQSDGRQQERPPEADMTSGVLPPATRPLAMMTARRRRVTRIVLLPPVMTTGQ